MASKDKGSITLYEGEYKLVGEGYEAKALTLVGSVTLYVEGALSVSTLIGSSGATIVLDQKGSLKILEADGQSQGNGARLVVKSGAKFGGRMIVLNPLTN